MHGDDEYPIQRLLLGLEDGERGCDWAGTRRGLSL